MSRQTMVQGLYGDEHPAEGLVAEGRSTLDVFKTSDR